MAGAGESGPDMAAKWINLDTPERDQPDAVQIDQKGNLIIVGQSNGSIDGQSINNGQADGYVSKSSPDGELIWQKLIGTDFDERITGVDVDKHGNIYVSGVTTGSLFGDNKGGKDIFVARLNTDGETEWGVQAGGSGDDHVWDITLKDEIVLGVTGYTNGSFEGQESRGDSDIFVTEVSAKGEINWSKIFGGSNFDAGNRITSLSNGDYIIAGRTTGTIDGSAKDSSSQGYVHRHGEPKWSSYPGKTLIQFGESRQTVRTIYI